MPKPTDSPEVREMRELRASLEIAIQAIESLSGQIADLRSTIQENTKAVNAASKPKGR